MTTLSTPLITHATSQPTAVNPPKQLINIDIPAHTGLHPRIPRRLCRLDGRGRAGLRRPHACHRRWPGRPRPRHAEVDVRGQRERHRRADRGADEQEAVSLSFFFSLGFFFILGFVCSCVLFCFLGALCGVVGYCLTTYMTDIHIHTPTNQAHQTQLTRQANQRLRRPRRLLPAGHLHARGRHRDRAGPGEEHGRLRRRGVEAGAGCDQGGCEVVDR